MTSTYDDPYTILELNHNATPGEIKEAYFAQVRQHPPERDPQTFKRIRAAYEQLRTPEKRLEANMRLLEKWPPPTRAVRPPELDLSIHLEDMLTLLQTDTDLSRTDFRADFREVEL